MATGYLRALKLDTLRFLMRAALRISSPHDFLSAVVERLRVEPVRDYLVTLGAARLADEIYNMAGEDPALRAYLVRDAAERLFRNFYPDALKDEAVRAYMIERGVEDLFRPVLGMASELGLPLAQRAVSYSQEGEDLILTRFFEGQADGFYVDVGAHHPFRFSNTYLLYLKGWRGINIDAMPGSMTPFQLWRPRDINVECMVSSDPAPRLFFQYDEPALNTVSEEVVRQREIDSPRYRVINKVELHPRSLGKLLAEHVPSGQGIDLMNVDVEGLDLEVLASNDWDRFRPRVLVVELLATGFADMEHSALYKFLVARGYRLISKLSNSAIFTLSAA